MQVLCIIKKKEGRKPKRIIQFRYRIVPGKNLLFIKESKSTEKVDIGLKHSIFFEKEEYNDKAKDDKESLSDQEFKPLFTGVIINSSFDKVLNQTTVYVEYDRFLNLPDDEENIRYIKEKLDGLGWTLVDAPVKKNFREHFRKVRNELNELDE